MRDLDKAAMGRRIRQIRLGSSLRQWELARMLGTTQSAVHKYEHGVVPEPRRLVELARIGETSVEWVLTGHHWENGSESQRRLSSDLLNTAHLLREVTEEGRASVDDALSIVRDAIRAVENDGGDTPVDPVLLAATLREHAGETLRLLESACRIQRAVLRRVARQTDRRLRQAATLSPPPATEGDASDEERVTPRR